MGFSRTRRTAHQCSKCLSHEGFAHHASSHQRSPEITKLNPSPCESACSKLSHPAKCEPLTRRGVSPYGIGGRRNLSSTASAGDAAHLPIPNSRAHYPTRGKSRSRKTTCIACNGCAAQSGGHHLGTGSRPSNSSRLRPIVSGCGSAASSSAEEPLGWVSGAGGVPPSANTKYTPKENSRAWGNRTPPTPPTPPGQAPGGEPAPRKEGPASPSRLERRPPGAASPPGCRHGTVG